MDNTRDGLLILAATPLGNLADATPRLRHALATADIVAAEDTRRTQQLARDLDVTISGQLLSHYDHNERGRVPQILEALGQGLTVLVVSDAGMPTISDPGFRIVREAADAGYSVTCLPGASAPVIALAISGIGTDRWCFEGFAARKTGPQRSWWESLKTEPRTVIFFESPHRLASTLALGADILGDRQAAVCRELTKTYEECRRGTLRELAEWAADGVRGEITVVVGPPDTADESATGITGISGGAVDAVAATEVLTDKGVRLKDACAAMAAALHISKQELYQAVIASRKN